MCLPQNNIPCISNTFKVKNLDPFFYEYALFKKIDISPFDISQQDLNLEIDMVYHKFFKKELLDTIFIVDRKNYLVELNTYSLKKYSVKVTEEIFSLFESSEYVSGEITLEFDKIRGFFYISNFKKWSFDFSIDNYFKNDITFNDLLLSFGYNPQSLLFREKISIIARLLPCVEKNINIIEITKPQVGKSYIYDEIMTNGSIVKKLGDLTQTNLFSPINSNDQTEAILKNYSILCIDEFHKGNLKDIVSGLQTFMENGKVSRGKKSYYSDTSIIMFANFKEKNTYKKIFINPKDFSPFKDINGIDDAFLQRINYINPSFGMRTLSEEMFLNDSSLRIPISLYQEIFNSLRNIDVDFKKNFPNIKVCNNGIIADIRTTNSIFKTGSAFLKLLFPNTLNSLVSSSELTYLDITCIKTCFYLAMEGISSLNTLNNQEINNLSVSLDENNIIQLGDSCIFRSIVEYFLDLNSLHFTAVYPHRYSFYLTDQYNQTVIEKIPLDTIGIEENLNEGSFYTSFSPNCSGLINNRLSVFSNSTNGYMYNQIQLGYNGEIIPKYFAALKHPTKNYLFGYNMIYYPAISHSINFDTTNFGNILLVNPQRKCPKCGSIFSIINTQQNLIFIDTSVVCPICSQSVFNYEFFPSFFEDFKG